MTRLLAIVAEDAAGESRVAYFDCSGGVWYGKVEG